MVPANGSIPMEQLAGISDSNLKFAFLAYWDWQYGPKLCKIWSPGPAASIEIDVLEFLTRSILTSRVASSVQHDETARKSSCNMSIYDEINLVSYSLTFAMRAFNWIDESPKVEEYMYFTLTLGLAQRQDGFDTTGVTASWFAAVEELMRNRLPYLSAFHKQMFQLNASLGNLQKYARSDFPPEEWTLIRGAGENLDRLDVLVRAKVKELHSHLRNRLLDEYTALIHSCARLISHLFRQKRALQVDETFWYKDDQSPLEPHLSNEFMQLALSAVQATNFDCLIVGKSPGELEKMINTIRAVAPRNIRPLCTQPAEAAGAVFQEAVCQAVLMKEAAGSFEPLGQLLQKFRPTTLMDLDREEVFIFTHCRGSDALRALKHDFHIDITHAFAKLCENAVQEVVDYCIDAWLSCLKENPQNFDKLNQLSALEKKDKWPTYDQLAYAHYEVYSKNTGLRLAKVNRSNKMWTSLFAKLRYLGGESASLLAEYLSAEEQKTQFLKVVHE